jgi:hypothetical protein
MFKPTEWNENVLPDETAFDEKLPSDIKRQVHFNDKIITRINNYTDSTVSTADKHTTQSTTLPSRQKFNTNKQASDITKKTSHYDVEPPIDYQEIQKKLQKYNRIFRISGLCWIILALMLGIISIIGYRYPNQNTGYHCLLLTQYSNSSQYLINSYSYYNQICDSSTPCSNPMICNLINGSSCNCPISIANGRCDCPTRVVGLEYYSNGNICVLALSYGNPCVGNYMCQNLTQNTFCNNSVCTCSSLKHFNSKQNSCIDQSLINQSCSLSTDCRVDLGLICVSGICQCDSTFQFWFGSSCTNYLLYNDGTCTSDNQCFGNLICSLSGSSCNCPITIGNARCDCPTPVIGSEYYWNSNQSQCVIAGLFNEFCDYGNYTCQTLTQGTQCDLTTKICNCASPKIFRNGTCVECPIGWIFYRNSCFYGNNNIKVQNPNAINATTLLDACDNQSTAKLAVLYIADIGNPLLSVFDKYFIDFFRLLSSDTAFTSSNGLSSANGNPSDWVASWNTDELCCTWTNQKFRSEKCGEIKPIICEIIL